MLSKLLIVALLAYAHSYGTLDDPEDDAAPVQDLLKEAKHEAKLDAEVAVGKKMKKIADELIKAEQKKEEIIKEEDQRTIREIRKDFYNETHKLRLRFEDALQSVIKDYQKSQASARRQFDAEADELKSQIVSLRNEKQLVEDELATEKKQLANEKKEEGRLMEEEHTLQQHLKADESTIHKQRSDLDMQRERDQLLLKRNVEELTGQRTASEKYHSQVEGIYKKMYQDVHEKDLAVIDQLKSAHVNQLDQLQQQQKQQISSMQAAQAAQMEQQAQALRAQYEARVAQLQTASQEMIRSYGKKMEELEQQQATEAKVLSSSQSTALQIAKETGLVKKKLNDLQRKEWKTEKELAHSYAETAEAEKKAMLAQQQATSEKMELQKWQNKEQTLENEVLGTRDLLASIKRRIGHH